jgi:hypothetical protein
MLSRGYKGPLVSKIDWERGKKEKEGKFAK